jgi:hypothetical protein
MNRVFSISEPFEVPDGTMLSPFLNPSDSMSGLPFDFRSGVSISAGLIRPHTSSKIHVMPFVTQVTFVRAGDLFVRMKGRADREPYSQRVGVAQAVLTEPGTFLELTNEQDAVCEVLYVVSPAYLFEVAGGRVVYDDSVVLDESWVELAEKRWQFRHPTIEDRREAERRLSQRR